MEVKNKGNVDLELHTTPAQDRAIESSVRQVPSHEEIRRRAYEIYLERGDRPGDELEDWLRAERELQKFALFTRGWKRLEERRHSDSSNGRLADGRD
jgi:hypothetical protein